MSEHMVEQLSAYLDDELNSVASAALERHLAACESCTAALNQLKAVKAWAPNYAGLPPSRDLWPSVKRELEKPAPVKLPWHGRRVTVSMPLLLAASVVLLLLSATVIMLMQRGSAGQVVVVDSSNTIGTPVVDWGDQQYDTAIAQLEEVLALNDSLLEPGTLQVIRQSLMKIDKAIDDANLAIGRDSSNEFLRSSIEANKRRKLALLRTATQAVVAKS